MYWKNVLSAHLGAEYFIKKRQKIIKKTWLEHVNFLQKWSFLALFEAPDLVKFWKSWLQKVRYLTLFQTPDLVNFWKSWLKKVRYLTPFGAPDLRSEFLKIFDWKKSVIWHFFKLQT